jgi:predicted metal-binding membrane protein
LEYAVIVALLSELCYYMSIPHGTACRTAAHITHAVRHTFPRGAIGLTLIGMAPAVSHTSRSNPAMRRLSWLFAQPKRLAIGFIAILTALGWAYLGLMLAGMGPGGGPPVPDTLAGRIGLAGWGRTAFDVLCRPAFGTAEAGADPAAVMAVVSMWIAMVAAMMLPTAGPMIITYAEMAETAARNGERTASPIPLIAGYGLVWAGFAVVAAGLQAALTRAALLDPSMASASALFSGAVFVAAGVYQFSPMKEACVTLCQQPAPFFSTNWSDQSRDIFRLGMRQGLYCVGCCWAMMLIMFAVGAMNVIWMALLGFVMAAEKIAATTRFSKAIGTAFTVIGLGFIAAAVAAHWPVRAG